MSLPFYDVTVVGNAGIDTCVYPHSDSVDWNREGHFSENIDYVGQAGSYSARGLAQLGLQVAFIGAVGEDFGGQWIRQEFARDGIDTRGIFIDPGGTARSVNFMLKGGQRRNFYDGKKHIGITANENLAREIFGKSRLALFHLPHWARDLLPISREKNITVACDLQDIFHRNDPYRKEFIEWSDILFFSAVHLGDPFPFMKSLLGHRRELILVSGMGANGCAVGSKEGLFRIPPLDLEWPIVDTNGAGDGLALGFLKSYVLEKRSLEASLIRGQIVARYTCTQKASTSHLITSDILEETASRFGA